MPAGANSPQKEIARGIVAIYKDYLGRGPSVAKTTITDDYVLTILEESLTRAELRLVEEGQADAARNIRRRFQEAMRSDIVELVQQTTGREVGSFLSDHNVDTDTAVELVTLAPEAERSEARP